MRCAESRVLTRYFANDEPAIRNQFEQFGDIPVKRLFDWRDIDWYAANLIAQSLHFDSDFPPSNSWVLSVYLMSKSNPPLAGMAAFDPVA